MQLGLTLDTHRLSPFAGGLAPSLDLGFLGASLPAGLTFSRSSAATMFDANGNLAWAPMNAVVNSRGEGGGVGVAPTAWSVGGGNGVSATVEGYGALPDGSGYYLDVRVQGTATATAFPYARHNNVNAGPTQTWTGAISIQLLEDAAGTIDTTAVRAELQGATSGNSYVESSFVNLTREQLNAGVRPQLTRTFVNATVARAAVQFVGQVSTGQTVNYLLRVHSPHMTLGNSAATYYPTATGVSYQGPRLEYDPFTRAAKGLLMEGQRTNLLPTHSTGAAPTTSTAANLGTNSAGPTVAGMHLITYTADATTASHFCYGNTLTGPPAASAVHTSSSVVSRNNRDWMQITVSINFGAADVWANFNMATGTWGQVGAGVSGTHAVKLADGAWRIGISYTTNASPTAGAGAVLVPLDADSPYRLEVSSAGSALNWGWQQMEAGDTMSSIIPTFGAAGTRANEDCSLTSAAFAGSSGTLVGEALVSRTVTSAVQMIAQLDNGSAVDRAFLRKNAAGAPEINLVVGSAFQDPPAAAGLLTPGVISRLGLTWGGGQAQASHNGTLGALDTSAASPTLNRLLVGHGGLTIHLFGHVRRISYFDSKVPSATLAALTAP